ncbi:LysR family transcriptional regulator ArgP [Aurantimonas sp. Leaf443]|uniref:LysR family transcriptional regulator ArgP n=1 Tax=Aurantimonas sp. Leaf443 TaxID=1736378 RepID=UPI0006FE1E2C|nr:LysR family transcriptional regulator ArgP [Aurantimonas sp. Leaf443]KQT88103.1 LysR family transcriptional regulator [Aurantimonas sp. Leaf443]
MLDYAHLAAVAAVLSAGSFERAAAALGITPSAVSQRVKLLEERLGTVLIVRGVPCRATEAGLRLARHVEAVGLLERDLGADLGLSGPGDSAAMLRIAVNADSLATWFVDAMARCEGFLFELVLDDQDHSAERLRRGEVCAAVSALAGGVQGCSSRPLGALRYRATASPAFLARWFADGVSAQTLGRAPSLRFDAKDELQARWMETIVGAAPPVPCHRLPSSRAFLDGARAGLGWGMNPHCLVAEDLARGRLVELVPGRPLDVALHWHVSRIVEPALRSVTAAVIAAAGRSLLR